MRTAVSFFIFQLVAWFLGCESSWAKPNIKATTPNKTLRFIENKGQWDNDVLYQCRLSGMDVWITKTGVNYTFYQIKPDTLKPQKTNRNPKLDYLAHMNDSVFIHRVIMDYAGANANPRGEGKFKQTAYYNYFIGNDTTKHASFVGLYSEVIVHDVYPHIDIRYYFERGQLRYDYVVNPGGDPKQIRFNYRGQNGEEVKNNQLLLNTRFGEVAVRDLYCYQDKQAIPGEFVKQGNYWQFALGEYDTQKTLIIDPLIFSTFLGGSNNDVAIDIDVDNQGNSVIVGYTSSIDYQVTPGVYSSVSLNNDVIVSKVNANGTNLLFSTVIGAWYDDYGFCIKIDNNNDIYIAGMSESYDYPTTPGVIQVYNLSVSNYTDAIITKLNSTGSSLLYSTYLGGNENDDGRSIDVDQNGNLYITGLSESGNFYTTPGAYLTSTSFSFARSYVTKINFNATAIIYSTLLDGLHIYSNNIKINSMGDAFVCGNIDAYPAITPGAYQFNGINNNNMIFMLRLNAAGSGLVYSTVIGANSWEYINDIVLDENDNLIATGYTLSTNFPTTAGVLYNQWNNNYNSYIFKLNALGTGLIFSTYFNSILTCVDIDSFNNIYVAGYESLPLHDVTPGAIQANKDSNNDIIFSKITPSASEIIYSTYLGGNGDDYVGEICIDQQGKVFLTGSTSSINFDTTPGAFDTTFNNLSDVFITKLDPCIYMNVSPGSSSPTLCVNDTLPNLYHTCTGAYLLGTPVNFPPGLSATLSNDSIIISGTPLVGGVYNYQIPLLGSCGNIAATGTISISPYAQLSSAPGTNNQYVCINAPINTITYALSGGINGVIISGLPSGVTGTSLNGIVTISGTPSVPGNFMYQITVNDLCDTTIIYGTIFVGPTTASLSSLIGTDSQTVCINTFITPITYVSNGAIGAVFSGLPNGVFGTFNNDTISIVGIPLMPGNYTYTIVLTGGCINDTIQGNIIVKPTTTIVLSQGNGQSVSVCVNSPIPNQIFTSTGATGAIFNNLPPGVTGSFNNGIIVLSGSPTVSGTYNTSIQLTGGCNTASMNRLFIVLPYTTINLSSALGSDSQQVCVNTPINNISYTSSAVYSVMFIGLPSGVFGSFINGNITIGGTPTVSGNYTYTVMQFIGNGCGNVSASGQIQVKPINAISLSSAVGSNTQQVCINSPITNITYTATGATGVTFNGLPPGVFGSFNNGNVLISGTPTSLGTFPYTIILTGGCGNVSASGQIQVKPNSTIGLSSTVGSDTQLVCINSPITNIAYTATGATGAVFSGLPAGIISNFNNGNIIIIGTPTVTGNYTYTVLLTGGCDSVSASGLIQVNPINTISLSSAVGSDTQQICANNPITNITYTSTGATSAMFNGLPPGVVGSFNNGNIDISGTPNTVGYFNYSVDLSGGCGTIGSSGVLDVKLCSGISDHELNDFGVYPNPNQNWFTIFSKQGYDIELSAMSGQKIRVYHMKSAQLTISENLAKGVYFLREVQSGKVMKLVVE